MLRGVPFDTPVGRRAGFAPKHHYHDVRDPSAATNAPSGHDNLNKDLRVLYELGGLNLGVWSLFVVKLFDVNLLKLVIGVECK
jgi:hypothetical protein